MSEGITHQQLCLALWIGTSSTVRTKSARAKEVNRFQLEKLRTACLNRNTYARRLSPKVADGKRWNTQTFQMVEGEMFVAFFETRAEAEARVCVCVCPSTRCSAADDGIGGKRSKVGLKVHEGLPCFSLNRCHCHPAVNSAVWHVEIKWRIVFSVCCRMFILIIFNSFTTLFPDSNSNFTGQLKTAEQNAFTCSPYAKWNAEREHSNRTIRRRGVAHPSAVQHCYF